MTKRTKKIKKIKIKDGFVNPAVRAGLGEANLFSFSGYRDLNISFNYQLLFSIYKNDWIAKKIIDVIASDMVRNGISIISEADPKILKSFTKVERRFSINEKLLTALKWGRLFGGSVALIMLGEQADKLNTPLKYSEILPGDFKGLLVFDRTEVNPGLDLVKDIYDPDFGLPDYYYLNISEKSSLVKVHHSRLCRFINRGLPRREAAINQYWGVSELEHVYDELVKRGSVSWNIANLTNMANLRVLKIDGLGEALGVSSAGIQKKLYTKIQAQNTLMNNNGLQVLGTKDDFQTHQYSFAGLAECYSCFMADIAGACEIPITRLFGRSPAGMNSTGESDLKHYYEHVEQLQESVLRPVFNKLLPIIFLSESGEVPSDLDFSFNSLNRLTESEKADQASKITDTVLKAFNGGLVSQQTALKELRQFAEKTGFWSNITERDIEKAETNIEENLMSNWWGAEQNEKQNI